jgi:predicted type IV restriction endonuclease
MASLDVTLTTVLATAEQLKATGAAGNEANTRALLIDPVLAALGWNLLDINEVEREFRVYDGTFLDYALRLGGKPRLFVEAKAMNKSLADKAFIAQTVNYANNEGVLWCVLTNGLVYQVYKSNEPVDMERKLLFEVDVREAADDAQRPDVVRSLQKFSKDAVEAGELDTWGRKSLSMSGRGPRWRGLGKLRLAASSGL